MKENVKLMRNVLKVLAIAVLFVFVVAAKSYAAEANSNFDNLDFVNIPENGSTTTTEDEAAKKKAEEEAAAKKKAEEEAAAKKKAEEDAAKKKTTSTSSSSSSSSSTKSASNTKMPATGSNTEIIFAVGAVILVSGAVFIFKKQNIKLK